MRNFWKTLSAGVLDVPSKYASARLPARAHIHSLLRRLAMKPGETEAEELNNEDLRISKLQFTILEYFNFQADN
jgi:hypothetical protein